jgi:AcrR family transcriptional regulator
MFCTEKALDAAMQVFWRKGYEGASMVDLTHAMGINSPSLYAAFGSKEGLFKSVLERYDARRSEFLSGVMKAPTVREVANLYMHGVADFAADTGGQNPPGCLFVQSGATCTDSAVAEGVAKIRAEKEAVLCCRFEEAKKNGELPKDSDPKTLARYLMTMANGMAVQAASGATAADLHAVADIAVSAFTAMTQTPAA